MAILLIALASTMFSILMLSERVEAYATDNHPYICVEAEKVYSNAEIKQHLDDIKRGATREDEVDIVYGYTGPLTTITHFWDADMGDDDKVKAPITEVPTYPNALQKARRLWVMAIDAYTKCYKDKAYEYLGHICHLLQDMSVPAHAHEDFHPGELIPGGDDCYEDWMDTNENYKRWDANDAKAAGGLINIPACMDDGLYYLMYTTNQYADYFASDDYDGDKNDRQGWMDYTGWPQTPTKKDHLSDNDSGDNDNDGDLTRIAERCFVYSIRATATLYKVFYERASKVGATADPKTIRIQIPKPEEQKRNTGAFNIILANPTNEKISVSMVRYQWTGEIPQDTKVTLLKGTIEINPKSLRIVTGPTFSVGPGAKPGEFPIKIIWKITGTEVEFATDPAVMLIPPSVGGIIVPVDKLALLAPYIGLASTILIVTAVTLIYVKRIKKREQNNGKYASTP